MNEQGTVQSLIYRLSKLILISDNSKMEPILKPVDRNINSLKPVYRNNTKKSLFGASLQLILQEIDKETNEFKNNLAKVKDQILDLKHKKISSTKKTTFDDNLNEPTNNEKQIKEKICEAKMVENQLKNEIEITVKDAPTTESEFGSDLFQIGKPKNVKEASQLKTSKFCEICRKTFQLADSFKWHVHVKNVVHFQCPHCVRIIGDYRSWKKHISCVHEKVRKYQCQICELKFSEKAKVNRHIQTIHSVLKPFPCGICKKSFGHSFNLKSHISSVHEKLRPFACTFCPYQCSYKIPLEQHINNSHKKIKKFQCLKCLQSYSRKTGLRDHYDQVHENVKLITCKTCQDKFSSRHQLNEHRLKMHDHNKFKEISFVCDKCGAEYVDSSGLTRHINENH